MGLFSKSEVCCICNENEGSKKIQEGQICKQCLQMCSIPFQVKVNKLTTKQMILDAIEENNNYKEKIKTFNATKKIGKFIEFDDNTKQILIKDKFENKLLEYKDIVEYELLEDGESITKGGLGRAVVGGVLFGGVGAVVGGITGKKKSKTVINSLKVKITINNISNPDVYINLVTSQLKANSILYKAAANEAQEIISTLAIISKSNEAQENTNGNSVSVADELIKLKGLMEDGILSQEEFDIEKNKLLSR